MWGINRKRELFFQTWKWHLPVTPMDYSYKVVTVSFPRIEALAIHAQVEPLCLKYLLLPHSAKTQKATGTTGSVPLLPREFSPQSSELLLEWHGTYSLGNSWHNKKSWQPSPSHIFKKIIINYLWKLRGTSLLLLLWQVFFGLFVYI